MNELPPQRPHTSDSPPRRRRAQPEATGQTDDLAGLLTLPSPFPTEAGTVLLQEPAGSCPIELGTRLNEGSYGRPFVLEQDGYRYLHFNLRFQQSGMCLARPQALDLAYTRGMMAFLLFVPRPRAMLLLGLGGGSLAKFCHQHLPATDITAVEVDADVIGFRRAFRIPPDDHRFRILHGDGASVLATEERRHDAILVDVFDEYGVPASLANSHFYETIHQRLSANGVLVMNIAGDREDYRLHVDHMAIAFDDRVIAMSIKDDGNYLLFAFKSPDFDPRWKWMPAQARELQARLGLDFPEFARQLERGQKLRLAQRLAR